MMLPAPNCYKRKCRHYLGIRWFGNTEASENNYCEAFPGGIPAEIAYGENKHLRPLPDQVNDVVFERA